MKDVRLRSLSAAVLLPPVAAALWWGGWPFAILLAAFSGLMAWEWSRLCRSGAVALCILCAGAVLAPLATDVGLGAALSITGFTAVVALAAGGLAGDSAPLKAALGALYVIPAGIAAIWLRNTGTDGLPVLVWLIAAVIATDVAAYFAGRRIGGPKLAPRVSPNKTWSGAIGGLLGAIAVSAVAAAVCDEYPLPFIGLGILFSAVAQAGDLLESALKRHFQVKDASNLIPGHGGFLDRLDGYLTTLPVAALMTWSVGGSLMQWQ
ncbi:MAG: phosphatidate cytidylyltransferase [Alphaproteobacteria bacterium]